MFNARLSTLIFLLVLALSPTATCAQANVVTTIKPLQLIAAAITDGVSTPQLLIPSNQSPHHFTLRPSDVSHLAQADLIVWIGAGLETYLSRILEQEKNQHRLLEVAALENLELLPLTSGSHAHQADEHYDPHLWLDTGNALVIANALHDKLLEIDGANAKTYSANLKQFAESLTALNDVLQQQFSTLHAARFAVFHNGTHYFEAQMGLEHLFVLVPDHEVQPGVRHLLALRSSLEEQQPICLLEDVNANDATTATVFQDYPIRRVVLDPLGDNVTLDRAGYSVLIENMAAAFVQCLSPQ